MFFAKVIWSLQAFKFYAMFCISVWGAEVELAHAAFVPKQKMLGIIYSYLPIAHYYSNVRTCGTTMAKLELLKKLATHCQMFTYA